MNIITIDLFLLLFDRMSSRDFQFCLVNLSFIIIVAKILKVLYQDLRSFFCVFYLIFQLLDPNGYSLYP